MVSVNHNFVSKTKSVDNISIYATMPGNSQVALLARTRTFNAQKYWEGQDFVIGIYLGLCGDG